MAALIAVKGPHAGQRYPLDAAGALIGRQPDVAVYLDSLSVSRHHARVCCEDGACFVEDLGSSNGTFVNGARITGRSPLTENDELRIGPHTFQLLGDRPPPPSTAEPIIRASIDATASNATLFSQNAAYKLQVVLAIARDLGRALELDPVLGRLLDHLLHLFPQADRGMALLCEGDRVVVRAQRTRREGQHSDFPYSRTIVRRALDGGVGLLSEDVGGDRRLELSATLVSLNLRSFLCVPLIGWEGRRLGVIQLDCLRQGQAFKPDDLELLTAVCLQASVVVENAALHAEQLREARLRQELLMAREIQQAFLPNDFAPPGSEGLELFAQVRPAREMSGDLYDFFALPDGRLAFFLGDVAGKGMPSALFMIAVRTLIRHLAPSSPAPAVLPEPAQRRPVRQQPDEPVRDAGARRLRPARRRRRGRHGRPSATAAAPRRRPGRAAADAAEPDDRLRPVEPVYSDVPLTLQPGETLILYTDGYTEAFSPDRRMFGVEGLSEAIGRPADAAAVAAVCGRGGRRRGAVHGIQRFAG